MNFEERVNVTILLGVRGARYIKHMHKARCGLGEVAQAAGGGLS